MQDRTIGRRTTARPRGGEHPVAGARDRKSASASTEFFRRIFHGIFSQNFFTPSERAALRREAIELRRLDALVHRRPAHKTPTHPKVRAPRLRSGPCTLCGRAFPHTRDDWRAHGRRLMQLQFCRVMRRHWERVGWDKLVATSLRARYQRMLRRKIAVFQELAPRYVALTTPAELERVINLHRNPKNGWTYSYRDFRTWVRKHYGTPPAKP